MSGIVFCPYCSRPGIPTLFKNPITDQVERAAVCTHCDVTWLLVGVTTREWNTLVDGSNTNLRQSRVVEVKDG